jgi:prevent-host-death family protein
MEVRVGVRELKAQLSTYLKQVKGGATLIITEHGKPIGQITPIPTSKAARMQALIDAGLIRWSGKRFEPPAESERIELEPGATKTVTDLLLEERR